MRGRLSTLSAALSSANPTADAATLRATEAALRPVGPLRERARIIVRKQSKTYAANGSRECKRRQATGEVSS